MNEGPTPKEESNEEKFTPKARCRDITQVRIATRRDRGGLEPKSKRGWRKREDRLRRTGDTQGHGPSTQRTRIDADTERR